MKKLNGIILILLTVTALQTVVSAQPTASQAVAERYAKAIAGFVASGDRVEYAKFVEANFSAELLKSPMQRHVNFVSTLYDQSRGYELHSVQEWNANEVVYLVRNKLTGIWDGLLVRVEADAPYKITALGLRPAKDPPNEGKRLSPKEMASELELSLKYI